MKRLLNQVHAFVTSLAIELSYPSELLRSVAHASQIADLHERNSEALTLAAHYHNLADTREVESNKMQLQLEQSVNAWHAVNERLLDRVGEIHLLKQQNKATANLYLDCLRHNSEQAEHIGQLKETLEGKTNECKTYENMWKAEADYSSNLIATNHMLIAELQQTRERLVEAYQTTDNLNQRLSDSQTRSSFYRSLYMDNSRSLARAVFGDECD